MTVTNNQESSLPLTLTWDVCDSVTGSCISVTQQPASVPLGTSKVISTGAYPCLSYNYCIFNIPSGSYTLAMFTGNSIGSVDSNTLTSKMCVPGPCPAVTTTTSSTATDPNMFTIFYPSGVVLTNINPSGSNIFQGACSNGMSCYSADWTPGTSIGMIATFDPAQWVLCWIYDSGSSSTCNSNPITTGQSFKVSSEANPHYAILLRTANPTPPVTITPTADTAGGSWSSGAFTLSPSSTTSPNLVYTPPNAFTCSNFWFLQPVPANPSTQSTWLTGGDALQGFKITYSQIQPLISTLGTSFKLIDGAPDQTIDPCIQLKYHLTYTATTGVDCYFGVNGGPGSGQACASEDVLSGQTVTLNAFPQASYAFAGWLVDGVNLGSTNPITVTMNGAHAVQPLATFVGDTGGSCTASGTDTSIQIFVKDSQTSDPIVGATVSGGGVVQTSDSAGTACLQNLAVPGGNILNGYTGKITVTVTAAGYDKQTVTVSVKGGNLDQEAVFLTAPSPSGFIPSWVPWVTGPPGALLLLLGLFLPPFKRGGL